MRKTDKIVPRVAPKNIQFQDHVQIKEIPRQDLNEIGLYDTWDPNLNGKEIFHVKPTKQRNIIIGFIICGIALVVVIIGIVLGIVLSQKTSTIADDSLTYNEVCTAGSKQCKSSQGLTCPNGFCSCSSPYSWNQNTQTCTLLTYNQACSTSSQCNSSLGLYCTNQICQCDIYHAWNVINNTCLFIYNDTLNYGDKCAINSGQCNSTVELICTGNCTCKNSKIWNISTCVCPDGTFLNSSNLCESQYKINISCIIGLNQCYSSRGLTCQNTSNLCQCDQDKYWNTNYEICLLRLNYTEACSHDGDCIPTLSCPTIAGVCNCPLSLPDYVCNCANNQYYDGNISQCVNRSSFNGPCIVSTNYTCLPTLYCNGGICNCPLSTSWNAPSSICI